MKKYILAVFGMAVVLAACNKNDSLSGPQIISFNPSGGAGGNTVTIMGRNFGTSSDAALVYFNGMAAKAGSFRDSIIIVEVPAGATTGKIMVSINGKHATSSDDFIILSGSWNRMADLPMDVVRVLGVGFSILGKGYFGMGYDGGTYHNDLFQYDPSNNQWTQKKSLPGLRLESPVCMVINDKAYIGIGKTLNDTSSFNTNQLWEYDPANDGWTRKADLPDTLLEGAFGVGIGNKGFVGLSHGKKGTMGWYQYNPVTDTWIPKADYPGPAMDWATGFALNGKVYVGLGYISQAGENNEWWQYDTTSDSWTKRGVFPVSLPYFKAGFVIGDKGYVAGGYDCWQYDDINDTWHQKSFYDYRTGGSAFTIGDSGYYVAGRGGPAPNNFIQHDFWMFDP